MDDKKTDGPQAARQAPGTSLHATMSPGEMPRERFLRHGAQSLSDVELIAIMLRTGIRGSNVIDVAQNVYRRYGGSLASMGDATIDELKQVEGLGETKAITLAAALELGRRRQYQEVARTTLRNSSDAFRFFGSVIATAAVEEFHVAVLGQGNNVIHTERVSQGGLATTAVDIRVLLGVVIRWGGTQFMVAHNHPAGSLTPSKADIDLTNRIVRGAETLGLRLLDHIIVAQGRGVGGYYSFRDNGNL